jgi:hypothetical protein
MARKEKVFAGLTLAEVERLVEVSEAQAKVARRIRLHVEAGGDSAGVLALLAEYQAIGAT